MTNNPWLPHSGGDCPGMTVRFDVGIEGDVTASMHVGDMVHILPEPFASELIIWTDIVVAASATSSEDRADLPAELHAFRQIIVQDGADKSHIAWSASRTPTFANAEYLGSVTLTTPPAAQPQQKGSADHD